MDLMPPSLPISDARLSGCSFRGLFGVQDPFSIVLQTIHNPLYYQYPGYPRARSACH